jgi:hypothetical protein
MTGYKKQIAIQLQLMAHKLVKLLPALFPIPLMRAAL